MFEPTAGTAVATGPIDEPEIDPDLYVNQIVSLSRAINSLSEARQMIGRSVDDDFKLTIRGLLLHIRLLSELDRDELNDLDVDG